MILKEQNRNHYLLQENDAYNIVRQFSPELTPLKEVKVDKKGNIFYEICSRK